MYLVPVWQSLECSHTEYYVHVLPVIFFRFDFVPLEDDLGVEMEEHECNCMPVGNSNAPTCYDNSCHNYATMQECRIGRCHRGCRNQRIQVC